MNKPLLTTSQTPVIPRNVVRPLRKRATNDEATPHSSAAEQPTQESELQTDLAAQQDIALDTEALDGGTKPHDSNGSEVFADSAANAAMQGQAASGLSSTSIVASVGTLAAVGGAVSMGGNRSGSTSVAAVVPQAPVVGDTVHELVPPPAMQPDTAPPAAPIVVETESEQVVVSGSASVDAVEGLDTVQVEPVDSAGDRGPATPVDIVKDTVAPHAPQLAVIGAPIGAMPVINGDGRIHVSGIEPGAHWQFSVDDGQTWIQGQGSDIEAADLVEGRNTVLVVQSDEAGNCSPVSTFELNKDTVAPLALQLAVVGSVGGDTPAPLIDESGSISVGLIELGATWAFSLDGGTTWVPGHGDSIGASELNEGDNTVLVMQLDEAGNRGPVSSITVLKDSLAPASPVVAAAKSGAVLINGAQSVAVETESGAQWQFSIDGGLTWVAGMGNSIAASDLNEGLNTVQIIQTDAAGNTSASTVVDVLKDSIAPLAPGLASGTILLNGNGVLNIATESGASWKFSIDGGSTWAAGTGSSLAASALREGSNRVQIVQTDAAGNVSEAASVNVLLDSVAPDAPLIPTGPLAINAQGSVQVTAAPGAAWSFSLDGGQTWTPGTGSAITAAQLREGNNSIAVIQSDAAGNVSETAHIDVRKDTMVEIPLFYVYQYAQSSGQQSYIWLANIEQGGKFQFQRQPSGPWEDGTGNTFNLENTVTNDHLEIVRFRQVDAVGNISQVYNFGYYY